MAVRLEKIEGKARDESHNLGTTHQNIHTGRLQAHWHVGMSINFEEGGIMTKLSAKRQAEVDALPEMGPCDFCPVDDDKVCDLCPLKPSFTESLEIDK